MHHYSVPFYKNAPFTRLLFPQVAGIILQWYCQFSFAFIICCLGCFYMAFLIFYWTSLEIRFKLQWLQGILLHLIIIAFSLWITWQKDIAHNNYWYGNNYNDSSILVVRIDEPIVEKERSFKATGYVESVINGHNRLHAKGKLLVYFSKDSFPKNIKYGSRVLIDKPITSIKNSGNPGAFDYKRYAAFHQTFHQVFLKKGDWIKLRGDHTVLFDEFIYFMRDHIILTLQKYAGRTADEKGIAEALLIGYKEDLDKDLVQAYSNAGVVHIIAISGLHLGLIYMILAWLLNRLPFIKNAKLIKVILLLGCLWIFSLLTGASGSVLRSAVMFTFVVIGKNFFKNSSIYNSLAGSAFILLCYDPYLLWDVGFQLSYLALFGIVWLQKPIERLLYCKQKWLGKIWEMLAVTVAAQIATFPVCIYYFHQFPNLFFVTNLIAVPLSTLILFAEILLILVSGFPILALYTGKLVGIMVWLMNRIIISINGLPFSLWEGIYVNLPAMILLYLVITCFCCWLLYQNKIAFQLALICLVIFTALHANAAWIWKHQLKMIIYNVPNCRAIDFIYEDQYFFVGDSTLIRPGELQNMHLKPARIVFQVKGKTNRLPNLSMGDHFYSFFSKKILLVDQMAACDSIAKKVQIDVVIISRNAAVTIEEITRCIKPSVIVFDSSNSLWKIAKWKKECIALALPCFSIPEQGAYMLNIE